MKLPIQDLVMFLGCQFIGKYKDWEHENNIMTLNYTDLNPDKFEYIKPILRPLSDMTNEEVDKIVSLLIGKELKNLIVERTEKKDFITAVYSSQRSDREGYDKVDMGIAISNIENPFSVRHYWWYKNKNGTGATDEALYNSHEITKYLISKHFDVFGWIEKGIALDKTIL